MQRSAFRMIFIICFYLEPYITLAVKTIVLKQWTGFEIKTSIVCNLRKRATLYRDEQMQSSVLCMFNCCVVYDSVIQEDGVRRWWG